MAARAALSVREATEPDADLLLRWRNDPGTRVWSRDPAPVAPADHGRWLRATLDSADRLLLVIESPDGPVGTVRFDRVCAGTWEVSITVAPEHRRRGLAGPILAAGEAELARRTPIEELLARVHRDNAPSLALFRGAGYSERADHEPDGPFSWFARTVGPSGEE